MRTFLINSEIRYNCHFYAQPESGKIIKFYYSGPALIPLAELLNLGEFRLISIQGSFTTQHPHKYNIYHDCKVLERGIGSSLSELFVLFKCKHIEAGLTEPEITKILRKAKLEQINLND